MKLYNCNNAVFGVPEKGGLSPASIAPFRNPIDRKTFRVLLFGLPAVPVYNPLSTAAPAIRAQATNQIAFMPFGEFGCVSDALQGYMGGQISMLLQVKE